MKIFPEQDVDFYTEKVPCWDSYRRKKDGWPTSERYYRPKEMLYWLDHDGVKKTKITVEDLYFKNWPKSRIRAQACLGMIYGTGFRFIKITKKPPAGFKCAPLPTNLATAHIVNDILKARAKAEKLAKKKLLDIEKAKRKAELAYKNRTKKKGRS